MEFGLFDNVEPLSATFSCCSCEIVESNEPVVLDDKNLNDPSSFSCVSFEGLGLDNDQEDLIPPTIVETKPYAVDEGYLNECCRFMTLWMSVPPMSGGLEEVDVEMEIDFGLFADDGPKVKVTLDPKLWAMLRMKKDLTPELLRWFLQLTQFNLEIDDKG